MEDRMFEVGPYRLAEDRFYDRDSHIWVAATAAGPVRLGLDPLGSETAGDIVALSFESPGSRVERGGAFGTIEAAKFVGPLVAPVSGTIRAHNDSVVANPALANREPLTQWLVEIEADRFTDEAPLLVSGRERVARWFTAEIERFRSRGMVAE